MFSSQRAAEQENSNPGNTCAQKAETGINEIDEDKENSRQLPCDNEIDKDSSKREAEQKPRRVESLLGNVPNTDAVSKLNKDSGDAEWAENFKEEDSDCEDDWRGWGDDWWNRRTYAEQD